MSAGKPLEDPRIASWLPPIRRYKAYYFAGMYAVTLEAFGRDIARSIAGDFACAWGEPRVLVELKP